MQLNIPQCPLVQLSQKVRTRCFHPRGPIARHRSRPLLPESELPPRVYMHQDQHSYGFLPIPGAGAQYLLGTARLSVRATMSFSSQAFKTACCGQILFPSALLMKTKMSGISNISSTCPLFAHSLPKYTLCNSAVKSTSKKNYKQNKNSQLFLSSFCLLSFLLLVLSSSFHN